MKQTEHRDMTGLEAAILFYPIFPGFLIITFINLVQNYELFFHLLYWAYPVCFPIYCVLLFQYGLVTRPIDPAILYFSMEILPTLMWAGRLQMVLSEGLSIQTEYMEVVLWFVSGGIVLLPMWLTSAVIYRWMKKRAQAKKSR